MIDVCLTLNDAVAKRISKNEFSGDDLFSREALELQLDAEVVFLAIVAVCTAMINLFKVHLVQTVPCKQGIRVIF